MISSTFYIRVRYGDTDQMGVVYHANYAAYFEVGRVEFFRSINLPYKNLEESGVIMPVTELSCKFHKSAYYDELLKIETSIAEIPTGVRIKFNYKIYNEKGLLITEGFTVLAFVDRQSKKPIRCPNIMLEKLNEILNS